MMSKRAWFLCGVSALIATLAACGSDDPAPTPGLTMQTLSNRADLVSGGNVLVEVKLPANADLAQLRVERDGTDVTSAFSTLASGRTVGLVSDLIDGDNTLVAKSANNSFAGAKLVISNHPIGGPVLVASQVTPWVCATPTPTAANGNTPATNASGLSTNAVDAQCNIASEYKLFYRTTTAGCSSSLPDPSPPATMPANNCFKPYTVGVTPPDLATTTVGGATVPYIVRVERGTLNRGIYDIAVLFDPAQPWSATAPQPQWTGKVVYSFGASTGQPYLQNRSSQNWANDDALSRGFMVVDNSLSDSSRSSNRVLNAETVMMMKEHIVDNYGEILFTMGNGCSGGSIGQNTAASIYPGLLDGIQPTCDLPRFDHHRHRGQRLRAAGQRLCRARMAGADGRQDAGRDRRQEGGHQRPSRPAGLRGVEQRLRLQQQAGQLRADLASINAAGAIWRRSGAPRNNCQLPAALVYDPVSNPTGTRCGDPDLAVAVWGLIARHQQGARHQRQRRRAVRPEGADRRRHHARGVRHAEREDRRHRHRLATRPRPARWPICRRSTIAYRGGIVSSGVQLAKLPIIDLRGWDDTGIHHIWRSSTKNVTASTRRPAATATRSSGASAPA